jgi:two-component system sensor histidine kinase RpfC
MTGSNRRSGPGSVVSRIVRRLRARPDSEHEMRFNGIALSSLTLIYLLATGQFGLGELAVYASYASFCLIIFGHILRRPQACHTRRIIAMAGDFGVLLSEMLIRGEATAFLFPLFIWVILGNGFRFGIRYLVAATAGGLAAFGTVIVMTPFWRSQPALAVGLLAGMCMVSISAAPLIRRLSRAKLQAEAASEAKSFLLASVGHELRSPLTAIVGTGAVLQDTKLDPAQQEMTRRVVSAGERLMTLVDGISRVDGAGALSPARPGRTVAGASDGDRPTGMK